jgi:hypothetical protein
MPLKGKLFDTDGEPMSPSFTHKGETKVYRYYVSAPLQQGRGMRQAPGAIRRVAAGEIEGLLEKELQRRFGVEDRDLSDLLSSVKRVDLDAQSVRISFIRSKTSRAAIADAEIDHEDNRLAVVSLPIRCRLRGGRTWITAPAGSGAMIRPRRDPALIKGLQQAHRVLAGLGWRVDGSLEDGHSLSAPTGAYDRKLCRLAFLAPDIQKRILDGRQPRDLTLDQLINRPIPASWPAQRAAFGFSLIWAN